MTITTIPGGGGGGGGSYSITTIPGGGEGVGSYSSLPAASIVIIDSCWFNAGTPFMMLNHQ